VAAATSEYRVKIVLDSAEFEAKMEELAEKVVALGEAFNALKEATDGEDKG
jgi:hypothetical protein